MRSETVYSQINIVFMILAVVQINCVWCSPIFASLKTTQKLFTSNYNNNNIKLIPTRISRALNENHLFNSSLAPETQRQKWQVGRVSRKTYEIVNMLWRKTKIFQDQDVETTKIYSRQNNYANKTVSRYPKDLQKFMLQPPSSTPSFIEFNYFDEIDDGIKNINNTIKKPNKYTSNKSWPFQHFADFKLTLFNPVFAFHVDNANYKRSDLSTLDFMKQDDLRWSKKLTSKVKQKNEEIHRSPLADLMFVNLFTVPHRFSLSQQRKNTIPIINHSKEQIAIKVTRKPISKYTIQFTNTIINTLKTSQKKDKSISDSTLRSTTASIPVKTEYDKVKFFELYDRNTYKPIVDKNNNRNDTKSALPDNHTENNEEILLEHVNQNIGHGHNDTQQIKLAKKHIIEYEKNNDIFPTRISEKAFEIKRFTINGAKNNRFHYKVEALTETTPIVTKISTFQCNIVSKYGNWSDYPFAAVYIYEPLQVHCDAAAISSHWLVTAGSCLLRHHKKPSGLGRSAFVTYCGEAWWEPERVAYVKYSVVHPGYHARDKTRKRLYNIGLIQVVNSMASACTGWQPISLMSHKLLVDDVNSRGTAVGWGLDRFDTKYPSTDLPRSSLSVYEGQVYSDSCPGNTEYSKVKRLDDYGGTKNVYCLSLPPYLREEDDTVHGGLLLVGGKLIALYLQEERRPWGEQCAEYTGTWHLIPWVLEIAREPEDTDSFDGEI